MLVFMNLLQCLVLLCCVSCNTEVSTSSTSSTTTTFIAGRTGHVCALNSDTGVQCWGGNTFGQLGDGTTTNRYTAVDVLGLTSGVMSIVIGDSHTCALLSSGGVKCWGRNSFGQLGDNTSVDSSTPVDVVGLTSGVVSISSGPYHVCVVLSVSGGVKCWGSNYAGKLGDGTATDSHAPVDVLGLTSGVLSIATGGDHTCAIVTENDGVKCWGQNDNGALGDGTTITRYTAEDVVGLSTGIYVISAGVRHTCVITMTGGVKCWGSNAACQLGDDTFEDRYVAVDVIGLTSNVSSVSAGTAHTCVILSGSGGMKCWGRNEYGEVGDGSTSSRCTPTDVIGVTSGVLQVVAAQYYSCVVMFNGEVNFWGMDWFKQLKDSNRQTDANMLEVHKSMKLSTQSLSQSLTLFDLSQQTDVYLQSFSGWSTFMNTKSVWNSDISSSSFIRQYNVRFPVSGVYSFSCAVDNYVNVYLNNTNVLYASDNFNAATPSNTNVNRNAGLYVLRIDAVNTGGPGAVALVITTLVANPTSQPSRQPSSQPTRQPSFQPSRQPSRQPSSQPTSIPSTPSSQPSGQPSFPPISHPTHQPSNQPSLQPSSMPSRQPTSKPTSIPSRQPSQQPALQPSRQPSSQPSSQPVRKPSSQPSSQPSRQPSRQPLVQPSSKPSRQPSSQPSLFPSVQPSSLPSRQPSSQPSPCPTIQSTRQPSSQPTCQPVPQPSLQPSSQPLSHPSSQPSSQPTSKPSFQPSIQPLNHPTVLPSSHPSSQPSLQPLSPPTFAPSLNPSSQPSCYPSCKPSLSPTSQPSCQPSSQPTSQPLLHPSSHPTLQPLLYPSSKPTLQPSRQPASQPTSQPSQQPSSPPTSQSSSQPSSQPSEQPSGQLSSQPTFQPSGLPSSLPTLQPSQPSSQPSRHPTSQPSYYPSSQPLHQPSQQPSSQPTFQPSLFPYPLPSSIPSSQPSIQPSQPSSQPSSYPSSSSLKSLRPTSILDKVLQRIDFNRNVVTSNLTESSNTSATATDVPYQTLVAAESVLSSLFLGLTDKPSNSSISVISLATDAVKVTVALISLKPIVSHNNGDNTTSSNATSDYATSLVIPSYRVPIDNSTTSITIALPDIEGAVGVMVSVVELSSSIFFSKDLDSTGNNSNAVNTSFNNVFPSVLSTPKLVSSLVNIQISVSNSISSTVTPTIPRFEASLMLEDSTYNVPTSFNGLQYNCTIGIVTTVSHLCLSSDIRINLTCNGNVDAKVRRQCPIARTTCSVLNLADNTIVSNDYCKAVVRGSLVTCRCGLDDGISTNTTNSILALNGKVSVGAYRSFATGGIDSSFAATATSMSLAKQSLIVFLSFGTILGLCLCLIVYVSDYMDFTKIGNRNKISDMTIAPEEKSTQEVFEQYLLSVLPVIVSKSVSQPWWVTIWQISTRHHRYGRISMFVYQHMLSTSKAFDSEARKTEVLADILHAVTMFMMSCFLLAVLYDLQNPMDDGYCKAQATRDMCEYRKTLLDPTESRCCWYPPPMAESAEDNRLMVVESIHGVVVNTVYVNSDNSNGYSPCQLYFSNSFLAFIITFVLSSVFAILLSIVVGWMIEFLLLTYRVNSRIRNHGYNTLLPNETTFHISELVDIQISRETSHWRSKWIQRQSQGLYSLNVKTNAEVTPAELLRLCVTHDNAAALFPTTKTVSVLSIRSLVVDSLAFIQNDSTDKQTESRVNEKQTLLLKTLEYTFGRFKHHDSKKFFSFQQNEVMARLLKASICIIIVSMNISSCYYLITKAAVRGYAWQVSFLKYCIWEWFSDVVLIEGGEVLIFAYWLPLLIADEIINVINEYLIPLSGSFTDLCISPNQKELVHASDEIPLSLSLATAYPKLEESHLVFKVMNSLKQRSKSQELIGNRSVNSSQSRIVRFVFDCLWWNIGYWSQPMSEKLCSLLLTILLAICIYFYAFVLVPFGQRMSSLHYAISITMSLFGLCYLIMYFVYSEWIKKQNSLITRIDSTRNEDNSCNKEDAKLSFSRPLSFALSLSSSSSSGLSISVSSKPNSSNDMVNLNRSDSYFSVTDRELKHMGISCDHDVLIRDSRAHVNDEDDDDDSSWIAILQQFVDD